MTTEKRIHLCISGAWWASILAVDFSWPLFLVRMLIGLAALFYLRDRFASEPRKALVIQYSIFALYAAVGVGLTFSMIDFAKTIEAVFA